MKEKRKIKQLNKGNKWIKTRRKLITGKREKKRNFGKWKFRKMKVKENKISKWKKGEEVMTKSKKKNKWRKKS